MKETIKKPLATIGVLIALGSTGCGAEKTTPNPDPRDTLEKAQAFVTARATHDGQIAVVKENVLLSCDGDNLVRSTHGVVRISEHDSVQRTDRIADSAQPIRPESQLCQDGLIVDAGKGLAFAQDAAHRLAIDNLGESLDTNLRTNAGYLNQGYGPDGEVGYYRDDRPNFYQ